MSETQLLQLQFGVCALCVHALSIMRRVCVRPSGFFRPITCMFRLNGHSCPPRRVEVSFETFVQVG